MPFYKSFLLNIDSDLVIPELQEQAFNEKTDIVIREIRPPQSAISPDNLYYQFENGLEFWVKDGNQIFYQNPQNIERRYIAMYLMDYPIIGLLYQRGFIAIHGSCVVFNDNFSIIITGHSGAGKSTTVSLFRQKGYSFLGDEICAIKFEDTNTPYVFPSYPEISLWETSINLLNDKQLEQKRRSRFGTTKYDCAIEDGYHQTTVPLKAIFRLDPTEDISGETISQLRGVHSMQEIRENSLNYLSSVEQFGFLEEYFTKCGVLCHKVPMYSVKRRINDGSLYPTADIIERFVLENLT
jgi:hypothetical protein